MDTHRFEEFELYLNGKMNSKERSFFEAELSSDSELYATYELYRTIEVEMQKRERHSVNDSLLLTSLHSLNKQYFNSEIQKSKTLPLYSGKLFRIATLIAAAVTIVVLSYFLFFSPRNNARDLATEYYNDNLLQLSQTMGSTDDSLQIGIAAYNNKDYNKALSYFKSIHQKQPENSEAKKYFGLSYLAKHDYENALKEFDELAQMQNLYSNPGMFLKAVTLLMRDQNSDRQSAKQILEQLAKENGEGSKESKEWLKSL